MPTVTPAVGYAWLPGRRHDGAGHRLRTNTESPPKKVGAFDWKNFSGESLSLLMASTGLDRGARAPAGVRGAHRITVSLGPSARRTTWSPSPSCVRCRQLRLHVLAADELQYAGAGWIEDLCPG